MPAAFTVDFCFDKKRRRKKVFALTRLCKSFLCLPALLLGWLVGWHTVLLPFGSHHWWVVVVVRLKPNISDFAILSNSRCRPLWHQAAVNDIRPSGGGGVHHPNIVGAPKHSLCYSLQIWANNKARSMFSMLCALSGSESFNDKVKLNSDVGSGWILNLWPMDLVQTFIVCLVWSAHPSQKDSIDGADLGEGSIRIPMGHWSRWESKEKVGPLDRSGVPAFAPQNPNTPLRKQVAQMFKSAIRSRRLWRQESRLGVLRHLPFLLLGGLLQRSKKSCQRWADKDNPTLQWPSQQECLLCNFSFLFFRFHFS